MSAWFLDSELSTCLLLQLPYCVSVLLLTSRCKSAAAHNTNALIIWHLHEVF